MELVFRTNDSKRDLVSKKTGEAIASNEERNREELANEERKKEGVSKEERMKE